jgi:hypothetical protein
LSSLAKLVARRERRKWPLTYPQLYDDADDRNRIFPTFRITNLFLSPSRHLHLLLLSAKLRNLRKKKVNTCDCARPEVMLVFLERERRERNKRPMMRLLRERSKWWYQMFRVCMRGLMLL